MAWQKHSYHTSTVLQLSLRVSLETKETLPMTEKIVRAKRWDQLWFLGANGRGWDIINVIAWAIPDSGPAVPITVFGRFDTRQPYVVGSGTHYVVMPSGHVFSDNNALRYYLEERRCGHEQRVS
jgi:hypothetical protein